MSARAKSRRQWPVAICIGCTQGRPIRLELISPIQETVFGLSSRLAKRQDKGLGAAQSAPVCCVITLAAFKFANNKASNKVASGPRTIAARLSPN